MSTKESKKRSCADSDMMELLRICAKDKIIHQRNANDYELEITGCRDHESENVT